MPLRWISQTLNVLHKVEPEIVVSYFSRMLESVSSAVTMDIKAGYSLRMLQIAEVLSGENSEAYAQYLIQVLKTIEGEDTAGRVIQEVVEYALTYIRTGPFLGIVQEPHSPTTRSSVLGRGWNRRVIDSFNGRKRFHGPHVPTYRCRASVRV
jgi:hypothetical protein